MGRFDDRLNSIYDRTQGRCHLCHKNLSFKNYGRHGERGAWHVEHSIAQASGGTDHGNNLYPACIRCNLEKATRSTRSVRSANGVTAAPLSRQAEASARTWNAAGGAGLGWFAAVVFAPQVAIPAMILGAMLGHGVDPE